jgi:hypothetical protein
MKKVLDQSWTSILRPWTSILRPLGPLFFAVAPKIIGGDSAPSPLAGLRRELMSQAGMLDDVSVERCGGDVYLRGRVARDELE